MQTDQKYLSFLMVGRIYQQQQVFKLIELAARTINSLIQSNLFFTDARTMQKMLVAHPQYKCFQFSANLHHQLINYIITIGGDGTILYGAKQFKQSIPPIISFQRGSLGFMCRFMLDDIQNVLQRLIKSHIQRETPPFKKISLVRLKANFFQGKQCENKKQVIHSKIPCDSHLCINQVYISRKGHQRITLDIFVDGQFLTQTSGDGLLISTPTGSTAYSLSAGGPLLSNGVSGILIVPIAPNSLSFRPLCLPSTAKIVCQLSAKSRSDAIVSFDGQIVKPLTKLHRLAVSKSQYEAIFFEPIAGMKKMPTWIQRLKYFLGWNEKYKPQQMNFIPEVNSFEQNEIKN